MLLDDCVRQQIGHGGEGADAQGFAIQLNHQRIAIHGHNGRRHFALAAYRRQQLELDIFTDVIDILRNFEHGPIHAR